MPCLTLPSLTMPYLAVPAAPNRATPRQASPDLASHAPTYPVKTCLAGQVLLDMEHAKVAVLRWAPFADTAGEAARCEGVDNLFQADRARIVSDCQIS